MESSTPTGLTVKCFILERHFRLTPEPEKAGEEKYPLTAMQFVHLYNLQSDVS